MSVSRNVNSATTETSLPYTTATFFRDLVAGLVAASVTISYAMSYSALMLPPPYQAGAPTALWAMLIGAAIIGAVVAYFTTIPPIASGADAPQTAAMIVLSTGVAAAMTQAGGTPELAAQHALMALSFTTLIFALVLLAFGILGIAQHLRLVPYAVVAGFLIATGWLLLTAGFKLATGSPLATALTAPLSSDSWTRLALAVLFMVLAMQLKPVLNTPFLIPGLMVFGSLIIDLTLLSKHQSLNQTSNWFLVGMDQAKPWVPISAIASGGFDWAWVIKILPDAIAIALVGVISTIIKAVGLETQRSVSSNINTEF